MLASSHVQLMQVFILEDFVDGIGMKGFLKPIYNSTCYMNL